MKRLWPEFVGGASAMGLLFLRVFAGLAMAYHGWPKVWRDGEFVMFNWMGPQAPVPGFLQALAALSEFGGGLALAFGLLTPLACLGIMSTMFVATWVTMKGGAPLVSAGPGKSAEVSALHFVINLAILLTGPGKISLDALLFGKNKGRGRY